jgi:hypothetical protein
MATKSTKPPAENADATNKDASAPATDTTEAKDADSTVQQQPNAQAGEENAAKPPTDGTAATTDTPPNVADAAAQNAADGKATNDGENNAGSTDLLDPNKIEQSKEVPPANDPPAPLPSRIKLVTPYGFYDDDDQLRMWQAGHETDDPDEIELLVTRGVEHSVLE